MNTNCNQFNFKSCISINTVHNYKVLFWDSRQTRRFCLCKCHRASWIPPTDNALDSKREEREDSREVVSKAILKPRRANIKPLSWDPLLWISSYGSAHMASYVTWILSVAVGSFGRHSTLLVPPAPLGLHSNLDFTFVPTYSFLRGSTMEVLELCSTVCDLRAFLEP